MILVSGCQHCGHSLAGSCVRGDTRSIQGRVLSSGAPGPRLSSCCCWQNSVPHGYRTEAFSSQRPSTFPATWPSPRAVTMVAACSVKASRRVSVVRGVRWSLTMGVTLVLCCWLEAILRSTYLQGVSRIGFFCSRPLPLACKWPSSPCILMFCPLCVCVSRFSLLTRVPFMLD